MFLSYASQDAGAAARICEALRAWAPHGRYERLLVNEQDVIHEFRTRPLRALLRQCCSSTSFQNPIQ